MRFLLFLLVLMGCTKKFDHDFATEQYCMKIRDLSDPNEWLVYPGVNTENDDDNTYCEIFLRDGTKVSLSWNQAKTVYTLMKQVSR